MSGIFPEPQDKAPSLPFHEVTSYVIIPGLSAAMSRCYFMCAQLPLCAWSQWNRLFARSLSGPDPTSREVGNKTSLGLPKLWIRPPAASILVLWHPHLASFLCEHQRCQRVKAATFTLMLQKSRQFRKKKNHLFKDVPETLFSRLETKENVPVNISVSRHFSSLLY